MEDEYLNFGDFIAKKRNERRVTLRGLARKLGISSAYLNEVEKDRRNPFDVEKLELLSEILEFSEEERTMMMDLAGDKRQAVAPDIPKYIKDNHYVATALRTARDLGAAEEEWMEMIELLKSRKGVK